MNQTISREEAIEILREKTESIKHLLGQVEAKIENDPTESIAEYVRLLTRQEEILRILAEDGDVLHAIPII